MRKNVKQLKSFLESIKAANPNLISKIQKATSAIFESDELATMHNRRKPPIKDWRGRGHENDEIQEVFDNLDESTRDAISYTISVARKLLTNVNSSQDMKKAIAIASTLVNSHGKRILATGSTLNDVKYIDITDNIDNAISRNFAGTEGLSTYDDMGILADNVARYKIYEEIMQAMMDSVK